MLKSGQLKMPAATLMSIKAK